MAAWIATALYLLDLAIKVVAIGVVPRNRRPASGMAWLLLIFIIPFAGFIVFLVLGRTRIERRRGEKQAEVNALVVERTAGLPTMGAEVPGPGYLTSVATLNRNLGAMPVLGGNRVDLFPGYSASIAAMTAEIDRATAWVHVEFYITAWDDVTDAFYEALVRATERGVKVRLLFDHLGSRGIPGYKELRARLDATAIEWHPMLPIQPLKGVWRRPDLRNHRKILVVDGQVAFTGSQNLIEPGYNKPKNHQAGREWVELMARVEGPTVRALNVLFATDWYSETGEKLVEETNVTPRPAGSTSAQVIPSGPGFVTENNLRAFTTLLYSAQRRISITSPYFVPDESLLYAVTTAAQRGVDIELFVSEAGDQLMVFHAQRSYYEALLRAGCADLPLPGAVRPALEVLQRRRRRRRHRLEQPGHALLRPELRGVADAARPRRRASGPSGGGHLPRDVTELTLSDWQARSRRSAYADNVMRLTAALQ